MNKHKMAEYLDVDTIRNAADLVNSTLVSKAYVDERLQFVSIDSKELLDNEVEISHDIYNNDKNILNIIYSLLQAVDRSKVQHRASNKILSQKEETIKNLNDKIQSLENRLHESESKMNRVVQFDQSVLNQKVQKLTRINRLQAQDLHKLKSWTADVGAKYQVEQKRKNLEIDNLKNRLISKRSLSTTTTYGLPTSQVSFDHNINLSTIYNNNPIINNNGTILPPPKILDTILKNEYEDIVSGLTTVIESLVSENYKLSTFIKSINNYYTTLNSQLANSKHNTILSNPSETIDLNEISKLGDDSTKNYFDDMESFEFVAKPIMNSIYINYHNVSKLIESIESNMDNNFNNHKVLQLENELELTKRNWQEAIDTMENWKKYKSDG